MAGTTWTVHINHTLMTRLVIFTDPSAVAARILLPALLEEIAHHEDITLTAIYTTTLTGRFNSHFQWRKRQLLRLLQIVLGTGRWERSLHLSPLNIVRLTKQHGVPIHLLPSGNPNHETVIRHINNTLGADTALNLYCVRIFGTELLNLFNTAVNYHNGALPQFRGLRASNWSLYARAATSGYTFHHMDAGIDTGATLISDSIPLHEGETPSDLELRKAINACCHIPHLLSAIVEQSPGIKQQKISSTLDQEAYEIATTVSAPSSLNHDEWQHRLNCFHRINTCINGQWLHVTNIKESRCPTSLSFRSADGILLKVTGINFWPPLWSKIRASRRFHR